MKQLFITLILAFGMAACSTPQRDNQELLTYAIVPTTAQSTSFETLVDSFFCIPLETAEDNLIGSIAKIQIDSIIALSDNLGTLHLFSLKGKRLNVIDQTGKGPGEYVQLSDFCLLSHKQQAVVLDAMQNKIIHYAWDGTFLGEHKLSSPIGISRFASFKEGYVFDQQTKRNEEEWKHRLLFTSKEGEVTRKAFPYHSFSDILLSPRLSLSYVADTLTYLPIYCDTVYSLTDQAVIPRFRLDFGDKWMKTSYLYSEVQQPMKFISGLKDQGFIYFLNVLETPSSIWLDYMYEDQKYYAIINKQTKSATTYLDNINEACGSMWGTPLTTWNDFYVIPVHAEQMIQRFGAKDVETDDNPSLLFVKFK